MLLASAGCLLFATRVFVDFESVRMKAVPHPTAASAGRVEVVAADEKLGTLRAPLALIARIRNDSPAPQGIVIDADGSRVCTATLPARAGRRFDCAVVRDWAARPNHVISFHGDGRTLHAGVSGTCDSSWPHDRCAQGSRAAGGVATLRRRERLLAGWCLGSTRHPADSRAAHIRVADGEINPACSLSRRSWRSSRSSCSHPFSRRTRRHLARDICRDGPAGDALEDVARRRQKLGSSGRRCADRAGTGA